MAIEGWVGRRVGGRSSFRRGETVLRLFVQKSNLHSVVAIVILLLFLLDVVGLLSVVYFCFLLYWSVFRFFVRCLLFYLFFVITNLVLHDSCFLFQFFFVIYSYIDVIRK